jgi:hypothetical protein
MGELIGYLVACRGAEQVAARMAAGGPQQFQCRQFLRKRLLRKADRTDHALIGEESIGTDIAFGKAPTIARPMTDDILTDGVRSGSPISVFYAGENFTDDAVEEVAGAMPGFGVID